MKGFDQLIKRTLHIDSHLLEDDVPDKSTLSVMVHELLHTCPDCVKHGYRWKKYATMCDKAYSLNSASVRYSAEEQGVKLPESAKKNLVRLRGYCCGGEMAYREINPDIPKAS